MAKDIIKEILIDPKHWIGWFLTVGTLMLVFVLLPVSVMQSYWQIALITLIVVVLVDVFKHKVELQ